MSSMIVCALWYFNIIHFSYNGNTDTYRMLREIGNCDYVWRVIIYDDEVLVMVAQIVLWNCKVGESNA